MSIDTPPTASYLCSRLNNDEDDGGGDDGDDAVDDGDDAGYNQKDENDEQSPRDRTCVNFLGGQESAFLWQYYVATHMLATLCSNTMYQPFVPKQYYVAVATVSWGTWLHYVAS